MRIRPPFKIHGGKYYLAPWIIANFPPNYTEMNYLEPYCGAASVLLNKKPPSSLEFEETINDLDEGVTLIFKMLRDNTQEFIDYLKKIKYCKEVFRGALECKDERQITFFHQAINSFILRRMSRDGLMKAFAWSERLRGGQPGDLNAWETALNDVLPLVAERIKSVYILSRPALEVIDKWNHPNTLIYCDPTYLHETRVSPDSYELEMTEADHIELARALNRFQGKAMISGYYSTLYYRLYKGWKCVKKKIPNHSSQAKVKKIKTECIWKNF
jgi:DNA adenine methylase